MLKDYTSLCVQFVETCFNNIVNIVILHINYSKYLFEAQHGEIIF